MEIARPGLLQRLRLALYRKLDLVGDQRLLVGEDGLPVRNAPSPMTTLWRFIRARLRAKKHSTAPAPGTEFRAQVDGVVAALGDVVEGCRWQSVRPNAPAWQGTGIQLARGDEVTVLAHGMLYLLKALDVGIGPAVGLWYRCGDGEARKLRRPSQVIQADADGELQLVAAVPGEFANPAGEFETTIPRKPMQGEYTVAIIRWALSTAHGLAAAARSDAALFQAVLDDYEQPANPPEGWRYLWRIGQGEVFTDCEHEDGKAICCHTQHDVGILQYPLEHAFTPDLQMQWDWLMESLPSELPEHIQPTHDYLSIAIEFDNGLDLTYMWSAGLPVDTIFQCPLPWWDQRETHWVLRNDRAELGKWLSERRNVFEDYKRAISGPLPDRVVGVWLIANAAFQRGQGDCRYRAISLSGGGQRTRVYP